MPEKKTGALRKEWEDVKRRILELENENAALKKALETRADKAELEERIKENLEHLAALRSDLDSIKGQAQRVPAAAGGDPSAGFWS